jgi:trimeric autotransporter adhesin
MSTIIGDMEIRLRADIARLQRDMDDARRIAGGAMDRIGRAAGAAKTAIAGIAAGLTAAAFGAWIKGAIDAGDAASKLSAKTGIAVKDIAGLQMSFELGGVGSDKMEASMARLSKGIVEGNKTLDVLRIKTTNADGSFRNTRDVLYAVADRFAGMTNVTHKAALAIELFGKSGQDLIPMLNGGSEAMREMDAMAIKLGMSISEETAKKAEEFNDTLDLLGMGSQGVARGLSAELLPTLSSLAGTFLTTMTEGDKLAKTAQFLGSAFKILYTVGLSIVEAFKTVGTVIGGTIAHITNVLGGFAEVAQKLIAGDFKGAVETVAATMRQSGAIAVGVGEEVAASWQDTGTTISKVWDGSGADAVTAMNKIRRAATVVGVDSDTLAKAELKRKKEAEAAEKALAKAREDGYKIQKDYLAQLAAVDKLKYGDINAEIADTVKQAEANEKLIATYGMSKLAIEQASLARVEEQLAQADSIGLTEVETQKLQSLIDAKKRNIAAVGKVEKLENGSDVARAKELLDIMSQIDQVTKSAAAGMADSFGKVGSAIGSLTTALSAYGRTQAAIAAELAVATKGADGDSSKIQKANAIAAQQSAQAQVRSYADMSKAAKGFFKENSTGYKVMEGAEKAFRAYEMAMAVQTMVTKSGFLTAFTSLFVANKATQTAAELAAVGPSVGAASAQSSAWGVTAVVKAIASLPFPANLAAGAATLAAVVAIGAKMVGGVGGANVSKQRQETQGTGSVFGASDAKSDSISRAIEIAASNSSIELNYTAGMLASLRNIESSLGGLGNLLIRGSGVTGSVAADRTGAAQNFGSSTMGTLALGGPFAVVLDKIFGGFFSKVTGKILGSVFGGKVSTIDTGITANKGSLGSVLSDGVTASQYADTKKSGGWFRSDKYGTQLSGLGPEADAQFTKVVLNMSDAIKHAGGLIGQSGDAFIQRLNSFEVDIGKISLKGLTGEQIQKELEAVFSKLGDDMAKYAVGGLAQFQQVGEGYLETLVRVATNYANLDATLQSIGMTFGSTGLASIAAREHLIDLMGGIGELASAASSFADNYLTEAERLAPVQKYVTEQLRAMGLASLDTRDKFKEYVLGLDLTSDAGQRQYASLMQLEAAFAKTHAATKDLTKSEQAIADERADLQQRLNQLTKTSAELRAIEREQIDASNRNLFDQIVAREDLAGAYDRESSALQSLVDGMKSAQASTLSYRDSLALGSLSTLTPLQKAAEAQRQYEASLAKVRTNPTDSQAYGASQAAATAFLTASQVINASGDAQVAAVAKVQSDMAMLATLAGNQVTDAQRQLSVMDKQYGALVALNETVLSFKDALLKVTELGAAGQTGTTTTLNYAEIGTSNMAPLVAEIKALRLSNEAMASELEGLRKDAFKHTEALIDSTQSAGAQTAKTVVAGQTAAYTDAGWVAKSVAKEMLN